MLTYLLIAVALFAALLALAYLLHLLVFLVRGQRGMTAPALALRIAWIVGPAVLAYWLIVDVGVFER